MPIIGDKKYRQHNFTSSIQILSSGDRNAPVVEDLLYTEHTYRSEGRELQDYAATVYEWKRNGVLIPTVLGATQYEITEDDIGQLISVELTIHEQDGTIQPLISDALTANVTGTAGWTLGKFQNKDGAIWRFDKGEFPFMTMWAKDTTTNTYHVSSTNGLGYRWMPDAPPNSKTFDVAKAFSFHTSTNNRQYLNKPIKGDYTTGVTMFAKVRFTQLTNGYLMHKIGTTVEDFWWNGSNTRIRASGLNTPAGSAPQDKWLNIIVRGSDTAFLSSDGVTNCKAEIWVDVPEDSTESWTHNATANPFTGMNIDTYGISNTKTNHRPAGSDQKVMGILSGAISGTEWSDLATYLKNLPDPAL